VENEIKLIKKQNRLCGAWPM